jgi:glycogen debranching enzyme
MALEWAKVAIDKGFVNNPDLGSGLIAGWGTSGESARPGFGWFFGGDTYLNQYAISGYGAFEVMRQSFEFLQKWQRADGKMMHELTQAGGWLRWFEEYPYGYYHGDTTPFYITSIYDFLRQSGDIAFLQKSWPSLKLAYQYCRSTDEDGDGLMDNTKAGLGASELGSLLEKLKTDILLGSLSPAAWRAMEAMAEIMGDARIQKESQALFEKAEKTANEKFWSPELNSFVHALTISGGQNSELTAWPSVGIMLGILRGERADATTEKMASADLSTDWGIRMLARSSKAYDPAAYNNGAVWPFLTGLAGAAFYERHLAVPGYETIRANAGLTWTAAPGSHPELVSGDFYRPLETAVPHQLFSSGGLVTPLVRGLLGLRGDAFRKILECSPHFPADWNSARIGKYRIGSQIIDFSMDRTKGSWRFVFTGGDGSMKLRLAPAFGLLTQLKRITVNGQPAETIVEENSRDVHFPVESALGARTEIIYEFQRGIEIDIPRREPDAGDSSRGMKLIGLRRSESGATATLEGMAGLTYPFRLWTDLPIEGIDGAQMMEGTPNQFLVVFSDSGDQGFVRKSVDVRIRKK